MVRQKVFRRVAVGVTIPEPIYNRLVELRRRTGVPVSTVITLALASFLDRLERELNVEQKVPEAK